ncbi:MAG: RNA polymerase sigma factor [Chloroflexia bacterium]
MREQTRNGVVAHAELDRLGIDSDEALAARGDVDSFVLLYRRHLGSVYAYLYARLGNRQEAEDVTTLVFERAWTGLKIYRPEGSFRAWLFTIAQRRLSDHYRQRKPPETRVEDLAETLVDPAAGPEEMALESEQLRQVLEIIAGLSREQQEVIALRFMGELRYGEIARVTGKREAAVKMIAYRALEEIRRRYESVPR